MPIPKEITDVLSGFGMPVGAVALATGLVRGAGALEKDASEPALRYVSDLLIGGGATNLGRLGANVVPRIFDRIFGPLLSVKFILRSILATTLFWIILLVAKRPDWSYVLSNVEDGWPVYCIIIPLWFTIDLISLAKARFILRIISESHGPLSTLHFFLIDIVLSYLLPILFFSTLDVIVYLTFSDLYIPFTHLLISSVRLNFVWSYFTMSRSTFAPFAVFTPSTLLTSMWTMLFMLSSSVTMLLLPIDYLRRFTAWWFRDVEKRPLTAIAKVAATLIILGALAIKLVHWLGA